MKDEEGHPSTGGKCTAEERHGTEQRQLAARGERRGTTPCLRCWPLASVAWGIMTWRLQGSSPYRAGLPKAM